ncbi:MAG: hypothetical protein AB7I19_06005 [Planctomycetota bacterium]
MPRIDRIALALCALLSLGIQLPGLGRPYGWIEQNPGLYYGVFAKNLANLGFFETRGVQLWRHVGDSLGDLVGNFHHPPLIAWLFYLLGGSEAASRLSIVFATILGGLALYGLLRPRTSSVAALSASAFYMLGPAMGFISMAAVESLAVGCGLGLLLGVARWTEGRRDRRTVFLILISGLFGPWTDWPFVFYCAGAVPLVAARSLPRMAACLWLAAGVSLFSLLLFLLWREWAIALPGLVSEGHSRSMGELLQVKVLDRPPWDELLASIVRRARIVFSTPFATAAGVGLLASLVTHPRLVATLFLAGLGPMLTFGFQADPVYCSYAAPLAALGVGTAVDRGCALLRLPRSAQAAAVAAVAILCAMTTRRMVDEDRTNFLRDAGRVMTAATRDAQGRERYDVTHDLFAYYGYYVESKRVLPFQVDDPRWLELLLAQNNGDGVRHLWLRIEGVTRPLDGFLADFPKVRVPELEGPSCARRGESVIAEAWLVTLREPKD